MRGVTSEGGRLLIDGEPQLVLAGEIHYFRVPREQWADRLDALVEAGCNTVASYIPWLLHELPDGSLDVTGATRPDRDVAAFIDLCAERGLWFFARPGPFVMAELMNEGIPYRIYREHPELVPVGWDGVRTPSRTLDYLNPVFLAEVRRWYATVLPLIASRTVGNGGNVIALQLDNEIGMLGWVTNSPDLTPHLLADFRRWVLFRYAEPSVRYPVALADDAAWAAAVRSPQEAWAGALRVDLALFMRHRFARYVAELRSMAEVFGVRGVPFVINIHGTEAGGGEPFPIGISQLVQTYAGVPGMISGSDHYVGELTLQSTPDLYLMNAFQAAVNDPDQPLTSVEFEAGSGDYGDGMDTLVDPATVDLKTRLFVAQGNRLINWYLFAGGHNRPLDEPVGNGIDRIAFTGERHVFAAPVDPEGRRGQTYAATAGAGRVVRTMAPWLAAMRPEPDNLQLGLVLDAYATEYHHPGSAVMTAVVDDLRRHRGAGPRRALTRSALLLGHQFGAVWLEREAPRPDAVLLLSSGQYLDGPVQRRLVDFVTAGGRLLLLGRVPCFDLAGEPCTVLADALGVRGLTFVTGADQYFPTVSAHAWAAPWPQTRVGWLEHIDPGAGTVLLSDQDGRPCGAEVSLGAGRVVLFAAELPSNLELFGRALNRLGATSRLSLHSPVPGVFGLTGADDRGQRLIHLINITGHSPEVRVGWDGSEPRALTLPPRTGVMLPRNLITPLGVIESADAELAEVRADRLSFGPGLAGAASEIRLRGPRPLVTGGELSGDGDTWVIRGRGPVSLQAECSR